MGWLLRHNSTFTLTIMRSHSWAIVICSSISMGTNDLLPYWGVECVGVWYVVVGCGGVGCVGVGCVVVGCVVVGRNHANVSDAQEMLLRVPRPLQQCNLSLVQPWLREVTREETESYSLETWTRHTHTHTHTHTHL